MLCRLCEDLDFDQAATEEGVAHHASFADLDASSIDGCELCMIIRNEAESDWTGGLDLSSVDIPNHSQIRCYFNKCGPALEWKQSSGDKIHFAYLEICTTEDDPFSDIICTRPTCDDVSSPDFFDLVHDWMDYCSECHAECIGQTEAKLPTRVIDIGDEGDDPVLLISQGSRGRWVTLSHCWGTAQPVKTELDSLQSRCAQMPLNELSRMFQDAITITRSIGCRYLWIDSLCIIQDSPEDWRKESANMGYIYKNSFLTIAAEACPDSRTGIFDSSNEDRDSALVGGSMTLIPCHSKEQKLKGHLICGYRTIESETCHGPLSKRAWTLQENVLSPRVLRFAEAQVWWECLEARWNERVPFGSDYFRTNAWNSKRSNRITTDLTKIARPSRSPYEGWTMVPLWQWYNIVNDFTARNISFSKDKFLAISGLAKEVQRNVGQEYKAGLWLGDMHLGLLWSRLDRAASTTASYIAPSWSWASLDFDNRKDPLSHYFRVIYHRDLNNDGLSRKVAKIINVSVNNIDGDPFGQVTSASLIIEGPSQEICFCSIPHSFFDCSSHGEGPEVTFETIAHNRDNTAKARASLKADELCNIQIVATLPCKTGTLHRELAYLHIASWGSTRPNTVAFVLILERADLEDVNAYRRVGLGMLREAVETDTIWPTRTLTII